MRPQSHTPPPPQTLTDQERTVERGFYESGALRYERATLRPLPSAQPPQPLPKPPAPVGESPFAEAMVWVLGAFLRGLVEVGRCLGALIGFLAGMVTAALMVVGAIAITVVLIGGSVLAGKAINGDTGGLIGGVGAIALIVVLLVGATSAER